MIDLELSKIIGHRGAAMLAPENTIVSFEKAQHSGVQWIECDVVLTRDNVPVIMHDRSLKRTTNGRGWIDFRNYNAISLLDAGSWFSDKYSNTRIPTLDETLEWVVNNNMGINLEIKPTPFRAKKTASILLSHLKNFSKINTNKILLSSFNFNSMQTLLASNAAYPKGLLLNKYKKNWLALARKYQCRTVTINYKYLSADIISDIKSNNYSLLSYTVNDPAIAKQLLNDGVDALFTDDPQELLAVL